jgi:hypothetical protein
MKENASKRAGIFCADNRAKRNELARNEGKEVITERGSVKRGSVR